jgi:dethiobiotin synthetase
MVPLLPSYTYADFARVAKLPILIVAGNKLGVINHLLLTIEKASADGLTVLGYLLNRITNETSLAAETNREALTYLTGVPCWGELPFVDQERCSEAEAVQLFERELDPALIERVLRGL